jgi:hypothetical protein
MSGESLLALAVCHAPHFDGLVPRPSAELPRIRGVELEAGDDPAAIFSNIDDKCQFPCKFLRLFHAERANAKLATFRKLP